MPAVEDLLRALAPQVLGALVRRYGHFDTAEDAVQEALLAAATQWPASGVPDNPRAWLITVASRRLTDLLRSDQARRRREDTVAQWTIAEDRLAEGADREHHDADDSLVLLFLCCHPSLTTAGQIALTLRAVGGLTTAEVARAFLVPEDTMTRRISRAKRTIKESGLPFAAPAPADRDARLAAVLHVLYLIFTEGYAATSGPRLARTDLSGEAIRLTRLLHTLLPDGDTGGGEVAGLLALMLLTDARRPARTGPHGELVPMDEQDRTLWDRELIAEGTALITAALPRGATGPYQLQAAVAAVHDEAPTADATDWAQIEALYELLLRIDDGPVVALNHAVAVAMARGPLAGLALLTELEAAGRLSGEGTAGQRLHAVRAHLLERAGDAAGAREHYREAARLATSLPLQRYLTGRADRVESNDASREH
ncbi:sigma-70 family RNA polymerase sigma factor [Jiangella ureilytica]|uniref:Sigma-70 family RNA polymerase sigma factor n=1 Tax=Jiangella ureilytica TaxID=2530374 RepID=A0A4R4RHT2_9ACTN|nr:sigma-70 family RNA polymerase sigma factor [Jiangella ureilytica]TDC48930.1 sigma-70 family RNA polymerase sigma factor [Jiangella ureilytica]